MFITDSTTAPEGTLPSGSGDTATSPDVDPTPSGAGETPQIKELRNKVREQGEENKALRDQLTESSRQVSELTHLVREFTSKKDEPEGPNESELISKIFDTDVPAEEGQAALVELLNRSMHRGKEAALQEFEQKYGTDIKTTREGTLRRDVAEFLADKAPSQARDGSPFLQYVTNAMSKDRAMAAVWGSGNTQDALAYSWMKFSQAHPNLATKPTTAQHANDSIDDTPTLSSTPPADFARYLKAQEGKGDSQMQRIDAALQQMRKDGLIK
jgi:hypothetical protein